MCVFCSVATQSPTYKALACEPERACNAKARRSTERGVCLPVGNPVHRGERVSKVLDELAVSVDGLERALARTLRAYQNTKAAEGDRHLIGYEPRDIRKLGAVAVIERRVRNKSSGFDNMPAELSYEDYPPRLLALFAAGLADS